MKKSHLLRNPIHLLAVGFGSGLAPKAPGTFGTLAAIPLVWLAQQSGNVGYLVLTLLVVIAGIGICSYTAKAIGEHDSPAIVWDEIAGYMVAFIGLPGVATGLTLQLGYVILNLFH
jgi:phosphatidylglycerophosphatase A